MNLSLKRQVLFFSIVPMIIGISVFCVISVLSASSKGKARVNSFREELISRKKEEIRNYTDLAFKAIEGLKADKAKDLLKHLRYGESGYFWINDTGLPFPRMIMHPTIPSLDGKMLNDPKYNCALGKKQNLFQAFSEVVKAQGYGYVDYVWPKPTKQGLTEEKPKLSYVRLYKPFGWIIGTGLYFDDIEALVAKEKEGVRDEIISSIKYTILESVIVIFAVYITVSYFLKIHLNKPVDDIISAIKHTDKDLTVKIPITTNNEIGELAKWFNTNTASRHSVIRKLSDATMGVNTYAGDISVAVEQQAATASELSAAVTEITSTMEELSASSSQIAERSMSVVDIATRTWEDTKKGANAVESVIMNMGEISRDNQNSIEEIVELGKKSKEISKVMEIINTIADQTKLIAFNAALEASSAGEAGKRFGVVAVEIRRLADSVMESTGEIEGKINEIQEAINRLVVASEKGSKSINQGMEYSTDTATLLIDIVTAAQETTEAAKQISLSTQQQKTASNQVVQALREIMGGVSQTSDSINQIMSVSKDMARLADDLKELVESFKLHDSGKKENVITGNA